MDMQELDLTAFIKNVRKDEINGQIYDVILPCSTKVTLREQNGNDDDVISSFNKGEIESTPFNRFVASLIVNHNFPFAKNKHLSLNDVLAIPLKSKYFIIMVSRIFSLGINLYFEWDWKDGHPPVPYEDDLTQYLWDYEKEFPHKGSPDFNPERISPYDMEASDDENKFYRVVDLPTGKRIKYSLLNGFGENFLLKLPLEKRNANSALKARKLSLWVEDKFIEVETFKPFTPREMALIRKHVEEQDSDFQGLTTIENPNNGETSQLPLLHIPDFFFPREI